MTLDEFQTSLSQDEPPSRFKGPLLGLWWDGKDDWERAHAAVASDGTQAGAWVHAYLHRKEGDLGNARYWYRQAGRPVSDDPLGSERRSLLSALLTAP